MRFALAILLIFSCACSATPSPEPTESQRAPDTGEAGADDAGKSPQVTPLCCQLNTGGQVACKPESFYCWNQSGNLTGAGDCSKVPCVPGWGCGTSTYVPGNGGIGIVGPCN